MPDINKERQNAVREAWKNEKSRVREGQGTRDWSQSEQREIVAKGRAIGYQGHHMKSVKDYPKHAGNPNNIQFLNRTEHIGGAHNGNTQNATNGYYNPETGKMNDFGNRNPTAPQSHTLSTPLTQRQQNVAIKREQVRKQAAEQAKTEQKQAVAKNTPGNARTSNNKGIEAARQKASITQAANTSSQSTNRGIASYQSKKSNQSTSASKSSASGVAKGSSISGTKVGGGTSRGHSNSSSQGR